MAIIYTYPQINSSSDLAASDLMIISDMSANGRPTKSLTLKNLADFITTTGTGTGTTNAIIKWTDGPSGLLGDSIMNEDVDKINLNGILRIADNNDNRLEVKYGTDSSTTHLNNAPASNHIIGRAGDLFIKNRARTRDILFQADNGEFNGNVTTYFRLDGSMADVGTPSYYTRWGDNSHIVLGNSANTNNLDFNMYHDGSDTYLINGSSFLYVESKGGVSIENKSGGSGDIDIIQSVTNADVNISAYNGTYFKADTSAGATIFSKPVQVPLVPAANANAASKQYVDQQIASIPAGLVFQGNWNANTNTPTLASGTGTVGNYYVVSVAGNTNLDGITDWEVGDWAVFVEVGGVDKWDKIDQTFVQGAGATGQVSFWNGVNSVTGDNDFYWNNTNTRLGIKTTSPEARIHVRSNDNQTGRMLLIDQDGAGDATLAFRLSGTIEYAIGIDNSDSDSFKISNGNSVGSTDYLTINSSGNVGIGTTSPSVDLEIGTSGSADTEFLMQSDQAGKYFKVSSSGNFTELKSVGDQNLFLNSAGAGGYISFLAGNSERMRINYNGNVGIGTTSPAAKLDVVGRIGLNDGNSNVSVGDFAGDGLTTGVHNTALGFKALTTEDTGSYSVAIGSGALEDQNYNGAAHNIAVGYDAGTNVSTGIYNVLIGGEAADTLTTGSRNIAIGRKALQSESTGGRNVAIGYQALYSQNAQTDAFNVAIGYDTGVAVTTGTENVLIGGNTGLALNTGIRNVAVGHGALQTEDGHGYNVAVGNRALQAQNAGADAYNVAVGSNAGQAVTTSVRNVIIGGRAADSLTSGGYNIAIGYSALGSEDTGARNVAVGYAALGLQNYNGDAYNVAIGYSAGSEITTGIQNTLIGGLAGDAINTANNNIAIGYLALTTETSGSNNIAIGVTALQQSNGGTYNIAIGRDAGQSVTTGVNNILIGGSSGDAITTGSNNVAVGSNTLSADDAGGRSVAIGANALAGQNGGTLNVYNIGIGYNAGAAITSATQTTLIGGLAGDAINTGEFNTAVGYNALSTATTAGRNVAMGWSSLRNANGSGSRYNSAFGFSSGENITSGVQNTIVGGLAGTTIVDGDNLTVLGYNAEPSAANATDEVTLGDSGVSTLRCAVTTITAISDERDKTNIEELPYGLDFVDSLKPKKFVWDHRPEIKKEVDAEGNETEVEFYSSRKGSKDIGFIAQELDQIDDEYTRLVYKSNPDKLEASYGRLIPILVKAIQELSAEVKMLKNK